MWEWSICDCSYPDFGQIKVIVDHTRVDPSQFVVVFGVGQCIVQGRCCKNSWFPSNARTSIHNDRPLNQSISAFDCVCLHATMTALHASVCRSRSVATSFSTCVVCLSPHSTRSSSSSRKSRYSRESGARKRAEREKRERVVVDQQ